MNCLLSVLQSPLSGTGVFAKRNFSKDEITLKLNLNTPALSLPTRYSIQLGKNYHIEDKEIIFVNHSCESNCFLDFECLGLKALRKIKKGEEITFNYLTTEFKMHSPFICHCSSLNCFGEIRGFKFLSKEKQKLLFCNLSPFLRSTV